MDETTRGHPKQLMATLPQSEALLLLLEFTNNLQELMYKYAGRDLVDGTRKTCKHFYTVG